MVPVLLKSGVSSLQPGQLLIFSSLILDCKPKISVTFNVASHQVLVSFTRDSPWDPPWPFYWCNAPWAAFSMVPFSHLHSSGQCSIPPLAPFIRWFFLPVTTSHNLLVGAVPVGTSSVLLGSIASFPAAGSISMPLWAMAYLFSSSFSPSIFSRFSCLWEGCPDSSLVASSRLNTPFHQSWLSLASLNPAVFLPGQAIQNASILSKLHRAAKYSFLLALYVWRDCSREKQYL